MLARAATAATKKPDADLGAGVIKQRIARSGAGKSGGYRTIILLRRETRAVFVYGFAKSERSNIEDDELDDFKKLAKLYLNFTAAEVARAVKAGELLEVPNDDQDEVDET